MGRVLAGIGVFGVLVLGVLLAGSSSGADEVTGPPIWTPKAGDPLRQPVQLYAKRDHPGATGTLSLALEATTGSIMVSGEPLHAHAFAVSDPGGSHVGPYPTTLDGPTLHVRPGDRIHIEFTNALGADRPTNIHYHGLHVSPVGLSDNVFRTFDDGKTYTSVVDLIKHQPVGTYWYHVHLHGDSNGQVMGGLSGLLIIEGLRNSLPEPWHGVHTRQLALRDVQTVGLIDGKKDVSVGLSDVVADQNPGPKPSRPSIRLVNAMYQPRFDLKARHYELWNLANIGSNSYYKVDLESVAAPHRRAAFAVVAEDGLPAWKVVEHTTLLLPPGKRYDVLVMVPVAGDYELMSLVYTQAGNQQLPCVIDPATKICKSEDGGKLKPGVAQVLATVKVTAQSTGDGLPDPTTIPEHTQDRAREDLSHARIMGDCARVHAGEDCRREFTFGYDLNAAQFGLINGKAFTPGMMPLAAPYVGTIEEWAVKNTTTDDHPFHIHVNGFQVMKTNAGDPDGRLHDVVVHGHQDIVNIPPKKTVGGKDVPGEVVIRQRFATFAGWFVFHCHILSHEDGGMMATIQVRHMGETARPAPESAGGAPHGMLNEAAGMSSMHDMSTMPGG